MMCCGASAVVSAASGCLGVPVCARVGVDVRLQSPIKQNSPVKTIVNLPLFSLWTRPSPPPSAG
eukprot:scaffold1150_cov135-Isochrysis_galbana.AAC.3